jgi:hypothetical protein
MTINPVSIPQNVREALQRAAASTGVDFSMLAETARRESGYNASAKAGTSSATGLFQFIESTWLDMVRKYGAEHGVGSLASRISVSGGRAQVSDAQTRKAILDLRYDPELSARMAGELARENATSLRSQLGRDASAGELYAAHVMGPAGAARLIEAAERGAPNAAALFPREAAANKGLFYVDGSPRSAAQLLKRLDLDADASMGAGGDTKGHRYVVDPEHGPAIAAFFDVLFHAVATDLMSSGAREENDPLRAAAAYAKTQRRD